MSSDFLFSRKYMGQDRIVDIRECPYGVMVKALDYRVLRSEFALQSCYYVHFQTHSIMGIGVGSLSF